MKLICFIALLAVSGVNTFASANAAKYSVEAFFNQSESYSYTDPYRNIKRKGQNLEKVVIDQIRSAKKSIYIAVQEIRLPLIALELVKKKHEGLDVRVVLENSYNDTVLNPVVRSNSDRSKSLVKRVTSEHERLRHAELFALVDTDKDGKISQSELMTRDAVYILRANKVKIKDDSHDGSFGSGLMHHKFMVVDGKSLIVSTANFTMSGIHGDLLDKKSRGNTNSLLKISSPSLAKTFSEEFFHMWGGEFGAVRAKFGLAKPYRSLVKTSVRNSKVYSQFSPTPRRLGFAKSVNGTIANFLSKAKKEVLIGLFVFSDQSIANTLKKKQKQNADLDISILIERKFATRNYSELLDMWGLQLRNDDCSIEYKNNPWEVPLKSAGTANLPEGDMLHHKFAVIDKETVIVGSQNWSDSANHQNDENILVIKDSHIAELYAKEFQRLNRFAQHGPSQSLIRRVEVLEQNCTSTY